MDREKAAKFLRISDGKSVAKDSKTGKVLFRFARQSEEDIIHIESLSNEELEQRWKNRVFITDIYGQCSISDSQSIALMELEMDSRPDYFDEAKEKEFRQWYDESKIKFEKDLEAGAYGKVE